MSKLSVLRSQLQTLRQRRAWLRWGNAVSAFVAAVIGILALDFCIDVTLEMDRLQRFVALLGCAAAGYGAYRLWTRPFLGHRETELDIALLVERQQEIDTDLVAALQFESPQAKAWGSPQLEQAVIDYVADLGSGLNIYKGFDTRQLQRRSTVLGGAVLLTLLVLLLYPTHVSVFLNRLLLGSRHYPTRTRLQEILVNGQSVPVDGGLAELKAPFGRPLKFAITATGELPARGRALLTTARQGVQTTLELTTPEPLATPAAVYSGTLDRLVDSIDYQLFLGDAWTDAVRLRVIPLPVVNLDLQAAPPAYAAQIEAAAAEKSGSRQLAVLEGSHVELTVRSDNKPLKSATLKIEEDTFQLRPTDETRRTWSLPAGETPLTTVMTPLRYTLQVVDDDELSLEQPLSGYIRLKGDRPPRIIAAVLSQKVLPGAKPRISFGATDDYGLAQVRLIQEVIHESGATEQTTVQIPWPRGTTPPQPALRGRYQADFKALKLVKGDQVKLTLEAVDFRGQLPGKTALSEPVLLEITDVQGFLANMAEADEQSARRLDAIIQRQLGIGDTR